MPSLPQQLLHNLSTLDHFNEAEFVQAHNSENRLTSIRLNPFKKVALDFPVDEAVKWNSQGYYLNERPSFTLDPLFHAGCYYPQEAGSMFLEFALKQVLDFSETLKLLDICAAPGGKSTLITSLLNENSLLVANEIIKSRADTLAQNLSKWGTSNTIVTNNDSQRFSALDSFFDAIVIDAPCSGSGLFRKQPEAIYEWSEDHVNACSMRQQKIISDILPALKENGVLFYSTCSYSAAENEAVVKRLVNEFDMEYVPLTIGKDWGIVETAYGYRFYPHLTKSEGFFCAMLRKKNSTGKLSVSRKHTSPDASKAELEILQQYVELSGCEIIKKNAQFHLMTKQAAHFIRLFEKQFYFKKAGVTVGEIKGRDMVPNHELALFSGLKQDTNHLELDKEMALKFLRKELFAPEKNIKGLSLMRYKNYGLGWAKILPNRINNYLPNELRILK